MTKPESPGLKGGFPEPGDLFFGQFRIESVLNRGGFGCVYEATQVRLDRKVAVKVLQPASRIGFDDDAEAKSRRLKTVEERFRREAKLVSRLRDPNTVRMHDYGTTEAGLLFMVLEFVEGRPLSDVLEDEGALAPRRCVSILNKILQSLEEAHTFGMLHRDIKPHNIMVFDHIGRTDQVKVLDFGLAKSIDDPAFTADNPDLTDDDVLIGTPRYMSPEQIRGEPLNPATDIYSTGLVAYEMLTGTKAVQGDSTMKTLARHINARPITLPEDLAVSDELRSIINRMLLKDRSERYVEVSEVLEELEALDVESLEASKPVVSKPRLPAPPPMPGTPVSDDSSPIREADLEEVFFTSDSEEHELAVDFTGEARREDRKVRVGLLLVLVVLFFAALIGFTFFDFGSSEEVATADTSSTSAPETSEKPKEVAAPSEEKPASEPDLAPTQLEASRQVSEALSRAIAQIPDELESTRAKPSPETEVESKKSVQKPPSKPAGSKLKLRTLQ